MVVTANCNEEIETNSLSETIQINVYAMDASSNEDSAEDSGEDSDEDSDEESDEESDEVSDEDSDDESDEESGENSDKDSDEDSSSESSSSEDDTEGKVANSVKSLSRLALSESSASLVKTNAELATKVMTVAKTGYELHEAHTGAGLKASKLEASQLSTAIKKEKLEAMKEKKKALGTLQISNDLMVSVDDIDPLEEQEQEEVPEQ